MKPLTAPNDPELRRFGWLMGALLALLLGGLVPWWLGQGLPLWPWMAGTLIALVGLLRPAWLRPLYQGWLSLGAALGWVNSRTILAIVFYLLVLPIGLVLRLLGKDPMQRGFDAKATTYRVKSADRATNHFERPF